LYLVPKTMDCPKCHIMSYWPEFVANILKFANANIDCEMNSENENENENQSGEDDQSDEDDKENERNDDSWKETLNDRYNGNLKESQEILKNDCHWMHDLSVASAVQLNHSKVYADLTNDDTDSENGNKNVSKTQNEDDDMVERVIAPLSNKNNDGTNDSDDESMVMTFEERLMLKRKM